MSLFRTLRTGWRIVGPGERRGALYGLALFCLSAVGSSLMVGAMFPFLGAVADPDRLNAMPLVTRIGSAFGLEGPYEMVLGLGLLSIGVIAVSSALLIARSFYITRYCEFFVFRLGRRLLAHYLAQPYPFFLERHSGDLASGILSEADQFSAMFLRPVAELAAGVLTVAAVLAMLIAIDPAIAGIGLLLITSVYGALLYLSRRTATRLGAERAAANARRFRVTGEVIGGIKDVKLSGQEALYLERFSDPARRIAEASSRIGVVTDAPRYAMQALAFGGIIVLCLVLIRPEIQGPAGGVGTILPALGVLALAAQRLSPEVHAVYGALTRLQFSAATVSHLAETLGPAPARGAAAHEPVLGPRQGLRAELSLHKATYRYPNADRAGIDNVTCRIEAGESIGIVGATGAGKTTLADVILGLLPLQSGALCVDGDRIEGARVRSWQSAIAYVPQDIFLTDASIAENIALGRRLEDIDLARVERCARVAQLHDFVIQDLAQGYDTRTGERGVRLSGGQRQRIGIARALYREADLIVLDEATSALDTVTERRVLDGIAALPGRVTLVTIAHRLSTVRGCSRLFLMDRGRIVAIGPWDVLLASSPAFRDLVAHSDRALQSIAE